jgi:hypothetical protein
MSLSRIRSSFIITLLLFGCSASKQNERSAQNFLKQESISASQAGSSPLFFDPGKQNEVLYTSNFNDPREVNIRKGLPNFMDKLRKGKKLTIAFMGGSVTQMDDKYRNQTARFIRDMYPKAEISFINAGVSGTGTDLGACRLRDQVLQLHPDLLFIEYAVNGSFLPGLEGIIRQVIKYDNRIDMCLLYAIMNGQTSFYKAGKLPENVEKLETVAEHYQLPAVFLGFEPSLLEAAGKLQFMPDTKKTTPLPIFSDGIHPTAYGGCMYAAAIRRMMQKAGNQKASGKHELPIALIADNWEDGKMLTIEQLNFSPNWRKINTNDFPNLKAFSSWFPQMMKTTEAGEYFSFKFKGNRVGLFDIGGPEVGQYNLYIDGKKIKAINRFNSWCNNRYRGQYDLIEVSPGVHEVRFELSSEIPDKKNILGAAKAADLTANPEKYNQHVVYLGKVLIRGELL